MLKRPAARVFHSRPVSAATWSVLDINELPELVSMLPRESDTAKRFDLELIGGAYDLIALGLRIIGSVSGCHSINPPLILSHVCCDIRTESWANPRPRIRVWASCHHRSIVV